MNWLEDNLSLPILSQQTGDTTHSVPFGAHSFIENKSKDQAYYESQLHSDASYIPLLQRNEQTGASLSITYLDTIASVADEVSEEHHKLVEETKQRYEKWDHNQEKHYHVMRSFQNAVEACYDWENTQRSHRVTVAHCVSLGVTSDLISKTVEELRDDTEYLKAKDNSLHETTSSLAQHYDDLQEAIQGLHRYVSRKATENTRGAADDAHSGGRQSDRRGRRAVWSARIRPAANQLGKQASNRARRLDGDLDYTR